MGPYRQLTWHPLLAIREHCLKCCGGQPDEVRACAARKCPLHPFRFGEQSTKGPQPLKAVRRKCAHCMGGKTARVNRCESLDCSLWDFRTGRNPHCGG